MAKAATVGVLKAMFQADTRDFTQGLESVEVSTRDLKRIQRDATTAADRYEDELLKLNAALKQGKISQAQYNTALKQTTMRLGQVDRAASRGAGSLTDFKSGFDLFTRAVTKGWEVFKTFIDGVQEFARDELMRESVELTRLEFEALAIAMRAIGRDREEVVDTFLDIRDAIQDLREAEDEGKEVLGKIGLSMQELDQAGSDLEKFLLIMDRLNAAPTEARTAFGKLIGGEQFPKFAAAFERLGGMQALMNQAQREGTVVTQAQADANIELALAWQELTSTISNFFRALDVETIEALTDLVKALTDSVREFREATGGAQALLRGETPTGGQQTGLLTSAMRLSGFEPKMFPDLKKGLDAVGKRQVEEQKKTNKTLDRIGRELSRRGGRPLRIIEVDSLD